MFVADMILCVDITIVSHVLQKNINNLSILTRNVLHEKQSGFFVTDSYIP